MNDIVKICNEPGCNEPAYVSAKGVANAKCLKHKREYANNYRKEWSKQKFADNSSFDTDSPVAVRKLVQQPGSARLLLVDHEKGEIVLMDVVRTEQHPISVLKSGPSTFETMLDLYQHLGYRLVERRTPKIEAKAEAGK